MLFFEHIRFAQCKLREKYSSSRYTRTICKACCSCPEFHRRTRTIRVFRKTLRILLDKEFLNCYKDVCLSFLKHFLSSRGIFVIRMHPNC